MHAEGVLSTFEGLGTVYLIDQPSGQQLLAQVQVRAHRAKGYRGKRPAYVASEPSTHCMKTLDRLLQHAVASLRRSCHGLGGPRQRRDMRTEHHPEVPRVVHGELHEGVADRHPSRARPVI